MSTTNEPGMQSTDDQLKQCRICLDNDHPDDIISPCLCNGSSAYVHIKCLNNWRAQNANGRGFKYCTVCQFEYIIEPVTHDPVGDRKRLLKYHLFVIRDLTAIVLLLQLLIISVAFLLKFIDRNSGDMKNLFPNSLNHGFTVYYLSSIISLLALLGFIALVIFFVIANNGTNRGSISGSNCFKNTSCGGFVIVGVILACALVGIIFGVFLSVLIIRKIMTHHMNTIWLRQEADKFLVKDFQGRRHELQA